MRTIVHLSDLHFGRADPAVVEACERAIDELAPDLVAISGDLTQRARRREFAAAARFIERLRAPVIATLGNHDLPLYNGLLRALAPRRGFRRSIGSGTATSFADAQLSAIAIDSTRAWRWKSGGVPRRELEEAGAHFDRRSAGALASCPHAAAMSRPRVRRTVAGTRARSSSCLKAAIVSREEPSKLPVGLYGIRLTLNESRPSRAARA